MVDHSLDKKFIFEFNSYQKYTSLKLKEWLLNADQVEGVEDIKCNVCNEIPAIPIECTVCENLTCLEHKVQSHSCVDNLHCKFEKNPNNIYKMYIKIYENL